MRYVISEGPKNTSYVEKPLEKPILIFKKIQKMARFKPPTP